MGPPTWAGWNAPPPRRDDYAPWIRRVGGLLIDHLPSYVALGVFYAGYVPVYVGLLHQNFSARPSYALVGIGTALLLAAVGWNIYNRWIHAGRTGQSIGRRATGTWLVSRRTGRPIGGLNAFLRDLLHVLDGFAYVGYLWPLWDDERQTFADKVIETIVVRTPVPPLAPGEPTPR